MHMYVPECGRPLLQKKFPGGFKSIAAIAAGVENARCRHARKGAPRRDDAKCCLNEALKNSMLYFRTKKHSMKAVLAVIHKNPGLAAVCGRGERDGRDGQRKRGVGRACKVNLRTPALFCIAGYRDCPGIRKRLQGEQTARPKAFRSCISYGFPSTCKADAVLLLSMFLPGRKVWCFKLWQTKPNLAGSLPAGKNCPNKPCVSPLVRIWFYAHPNMDCQSCVIAISFAVTSTLTMLDIN